MLTRQGATKRLRTALKHLEAVFGTRRAIDITAAAVDIPQITAMKLSGHRSFSVFKRYGIQSEEMLRDAGGRLQRLHEKEPKTPERKVASITV